MLEDRGTATRQLVETAFSLLEHYHGLAASGALSEADSQQSSLGCVDVLSQPNQYTSEVDKVQISARIFIETRKNPTKLFDASDETFDPIAFFDKAGDHNLAAPRDSLLAE